MLNAKFFDEVSAKLGEVVKNSPARDIEKNARALLMQGIRCAGASADAHP